MNAKALGIIAALKGRKGTGDKKKSGLLCIAEKLTARRKAEKDGSGGCGKKK